MKTKRTICALLLFAFVCTALNNVTAKPNRSIASWTVLVYLDADNNLDSLTQTDLDELMAVGSTDDVNVLALVDRRYDIANLYKICEGDLENQTDFELNGQEVNMGDPKTLRSFVSYARDNFPADHTLLFFWDHGTPLLGVGVDEHTGVSDASDWLSHQEVVEALESFKIDIVATDECLVGQIEVAYEYFIGGLQTEYLIASEGYIGYIGFPYDAILARLVNDPDMSARDLSLVIIEEFSSLLSQPPYMSEVVTAQSAIALNEIDEVVGNLGTLTQLLTEEMKRYVGVISAARSRSMLPWGEYGMEAVVDLKTLVEHIGDCAPESSAIKEASLAVLTSLDRAVLGVGTTMVTETLPFEGMGIFFPPSSNAFEHHLPTALALYETFAFAQDGWLDFLETYWKPGPH